MSVSKKSVVMIGATGAVGSKTVQILLRMPEIGRLTLLGRRTTSDIESTILHQHKVNLFDSTSYSDLLSGHDTAICTLGVGQPSKMNKEDFIKIDKVAVLDFASACKKAGVTHFELLASVGINAKSSSFYLRTKGELVEALDEMSFDSLSVFQPSMILTTNNRYGFSQGVLLKVWPLLKPLLFGGFKKYRGIRVADLGKAIARNILTTKKGKTNLFWGDFQNLLKD